MNKITEIGSTTPNKPVIACIKELLGRAEKGQVQSIAVVGTDNEGYVFNQFNTQGQAIKLIASLRILERDLIDIHCDLRVDITND